MQQSIVHSTLSQVALGVNITSHTHCSTYMYIQCPKLKHEIKLKCCMYLFHFWYSSESLVLALGEIVLQINKYMKQSVHIVKTANLNT